MSLPLTHSKIMRRLATCVAAFALVLPAAAQLRGGPVGGAVVLHDAARFGGQGVAIDGPVPSLSDAQFNDRTSSITVNQGVWEVCSDGNFRGKCQIIDGDVADTRALGLDNSISSIRPASARGTSPIGSGAVDADAPIVFYADQSFRGEARAISGDLRDMDTLRFNDRARSVRVNAGVWQVCTDAGLRGKCEYIDSSIRDLRDIGLSGNISSVAATPYPQGPAAYGITLFKDAGLRGAYLGFDAAVPDLSQFTYNDTASSVLVSEGNWLLCSDANYQGACEVVSSTVNDLYTLELNDRVSSLRPYDGRGNRGGNRGGARGGYGDAPRGGRGPRGGQNGANGFQGEQSVFFPAPTDGYGERLRNGTGAATRFCQSQGFRRGVYKADGPVLSDVVCE